MAEYQHGTEAHLGQAVKTGKEVTIPIAPELLEVLKEAQAWKIDQYVCPLSATRYNKTNKAGKNVGNNLIDIDVLRVICWICLEPSVEAPGRKKKMTVYGFHFLRHSFASFCAEAGVPKAILLSILGTDSDIADKYYTHVGDESQRKAVEAISGRSSEKSAQAKIDEVLELLKDDPQPTRVLLEHIKQLLMQKEDLWKTQQCLWMGNHRQKNLGNVLNSVKNFST